MEQEDEFDVVDRVGEIAILSVGCFVARADHNMQQSSQFFSSSPSRRGYRTNRNVSSIASASSPSGVIWKMRVPSST